MEELIFLLGEPLARGSASQGSRADLMTREAPSVSPIADFLKLCVPAGSSGKTYQGCSAPMEAKISERSSAKLMRSGILAHGECWTLNMCEWTASLVPFLREDGVSSLSDILETGAIPPQYYLSPDACRGNTPPRRVKGTGVARSLTASTGGASGKEQHTFISGDGRLLNALGIDGYNGSVTGSVSATVDTRCKNTNGPTLIMEHYQANGLVMDAEFWNGEDVSTTLTEAFADDRMPDKGKLPCVICRAGFSGGQGEKAGGIGYEDEVAPTIRSAESGSNQVPDILCQYGDVAGALTARHDSSPCADRGMNFVYESHPQDSRVKPCGECSPQLNAKAGTGGGNLPLVQECFPAAAVRRLLPVECERLMGFPDNWTRIPWRGKSEEQCPGSPRYKACGNSMCVNVMRWIGMRIENVEKTKGL